MKQILLLLLLIEGALAGSYTLESLLYTAGKHNDLSKALSQEALSLKAKSRADTATDPIALYVEGTRAYPDGGKSGNEYAVGASKTFKLPTIREQELAIQQLSNDAVMLEGKKSLLNFRNGLKNLYHQHCLDQQNYRVFKRSYEDFVKLFKKKQKAYTYQEISLRELMQLETEKNRLYAKLMSLDMERKISKETLTTLAGISEHAQFSCQDIYPVRSRVSLPKSFSLTKEAYNKRLQSTKKAVERYSHGFDSVDVSAQYTNELDVDRYTIGVTIPLNFGSEKYEQERVAAMYQNSAIEHRYHQVLKEKRSQLTRLRLMLKSEAAMTHALMKNYRKYKQKVLPLMRKSYDLGETSVIEYLLSKQKLYQLQEEIYQTKKAYYNTLFQLYSVSEKKDI